MSADARRSASSTITERVTWQWQSARLQPEDSWNDAQCEQRSQIMRLSNALMVEQDVLTTMGFERLAKSQISELCNELDAKAGDFRNRPLTDEYPYLWLDALYEKVHIGDSVVSNAFVIAYGVTVSGIRDVLAIDVVDTESKESWARFLQGLRRRARDGKLGTKLVISDAHEGLKAATAVVFQGASWQRCKVHFFRNILAHVPQSRKLDVAAGLRNVFAQVSNDAAQRAATEFREKFETSS